ncbi:MAG: LarC family nickel insertion protein [Spirochaetales bacterium]|nr:LarC family nickel insertion protein [Spirochaetales bacterium]
MLYFDLLCGASGDMILASLIDLGVPLSYLTGRLAALEIPGLTIRQDRRMRSGRSCVQLQIGWREAAQLEHRNLGSIIALLKRGRYPAQVVETCRLVLSRLAEAESRAHGVAVDQVHFHELGAVDTVVDVLGFALCIDYLGVEGITFSTLTVGSGTVVTSRGTLPVPAPATRIMLSEFRVRRLDTGTEILTPTGCAILTSSGRQVHAQPQGRLLAEGFGCGQREIRSCAGYLRVMRLSKDGGSRDQAAASTSSS